MVGTDDAEIIIQEHLKKYGITGKLMEKVK